MTFTHGERDTLLTYLDHYRATLLRTCEDLTPAQLATAAVPPSKLSLLGLLRHLAAVEQSWFRRVMGRDLGLPRLYDKLVDHDRDFDGVEPTQACVDEAYATLAREVAHAREYVAAQTDLGVLGQHDEGDIELREVLVHLIEEYARHCGHADLIREVLDGRTGH